MNLPAYSKSLPRKVTICGVRYKITYNLRGGACFDCTDCFIKVGCRGTRDIAMQSLFHEISEIIHVSLLQRFYSSYENGDKRFIMTHDDFERHNNELVGALRNCGLLK